MDDFGGAFGVLLRVFGRSWGPLGCLVTALEASWGGLGVLGNAEERLTMFPCVREQDQDLRAHRRFTVGGLFLGPTSNLTIWPETETLA